MRNGLIQFSTLLDLLDERAARYGRKTAFTFVTAGKDDEVHLSYADLQSQSRAIGAGLQQALSPGECVLLLLPTGPEFVTAFFGSLCAGVLPVPLPMPRHRRDQRNLQRLQSVLQKTGARCILGHRKGQKLIGNDPAGIRLEAVARAEWINMDALAASTAEKWVRPRVDAASPAYLQFTSGATLEPRGVVLTHGNILANLEYIKKIFGHSEDLIGVGWLPLSHDMGLVGHVLEPLYAGGSSILMPPSSFLQDPLSWLRAVSHYGAMTSGAPPFAYELCRRRWRPDRFDLDLSRWKNAYVGAEMVRAETLEAFADKFAQHGFRKESLLPCYGLAEATLLVAGKRGDWAEKTVNIPAPARGNTGSRTPGVRRRTLVGYPCHREFTAVHIRKPETGRCCRSGQIGEICLSGSSVARTYWQDPAASRQTFPVMGDGEATGFLLRTGDLGFVENDYLFITGRLKELIVIRGDNHYPLDLEKTIQESHLLLQPGAGACFAVSGESTEKLVVVQEVQRAWQSAGQEDIFQAIRGAVAEQHGIEVAGIALIAYGTLPKTPNGKIARSRCKELYLKDELKTLAAWKRRAPSEQQRPSGLQVAVNSPVAGKRQAGQANADDIAVIGMACRFPAETDHPKSLWRVLAEGLDGICEVPPDRWDNSRYYDPRPAIPGKMNTKWGGFIRGIDRFDPELFGIASHEAAEIDPQQRLLLEVAWRAFENAGLSLEKLSGSDTGVYVGISTNDYLQLQIRHMPGLEYLNAYSGLGNAISISANRISYVFNLQGPSMAVDTACSSSLTALHLASESIRNGEASLAVAGGVNLILSPGTTVALSQFNMMAPDGRCKVFDARADGYVRSEGCGLVVLKKKSAALRDGDNILAYLRGSALGQDGRSQGITAPNGEAQRQVIKKALVRAGCHPSQISLVEAHGTGTAVGDPVEVEQLVSVYGSKRQGDACYLGSVKANLGHLEAAAGIASVIKVILALQHKQIPPQLHLQHLNPRISLPGNHLIIPRKLTDWPAKSRPRMAAVSSFGFGGANVHLILAEAGEVAGQDRFPAAGQGPQHRMQLLTVSGKSPIALQKQAEAWLGMLDRTPLGLLPSLCYSQAARRSHFPHRAAFVAASQSELSRKLKTFLRKPGWGMGAVKPDPGCTGVAFLFSGQGALFPAMGRELYDNYPIFRREFDRCAAVFDLEAGLAHSLGELLFECEDEAKTLLYESPYTQPAMFALEYALARLWIHWGVVPRALMGHSLGEYTAACLAGCFGAEEGMRLVTERSRLIHGLPGQGSMAAVFGAEKEISALAATHAKKVSTAAVNGPRATVISGELTQLDKVLSALKNQGISFKMLPVSHAFHSAQMDDILDEFEAFAARMRFNRPQRTLVSNVTGRVMTAAPDAAHWRKHLRRCVRFRDGMQSLAQAGINTFVEVGPGHSLIMLGQSCLPLNNFTFLPSIERDIPAAKTVLKTLGRLYAEGLDVNWSGVYEGASCRFIADLPGHPFHRKRYWFNFDGRQEAISPQLPPGGEAPDRAAKRNQWLYDIRWVPKKLPVLQIEDRRAATLDSNRQLFWIIVGDGKGLARKLAMRLREPQHHVFWISQESARWKRGFSQKPADRESGADRFVIPPGCGRETYLGLVSYILDQVSRRDVKRWKVLYLGALDTVSGEQMTVETLERDQALHGVADLVALVQALHKTTQVFSLWIVTQHAEPVHMAGEPDCKDILHLAQTPLWGLGKTLFLEHPEMRGGLVDLDLDPDPQGQVEQLIHQIIAGGTERQVAFRNDQRYIAQLVPVSGPWAQQTGHLRSDGVYMVTGGLGGLGLKCAGWLARKGAGRIMLIGRRGLPPRRDWNTLPPENGDYAKVQAIRRIEEQGVAVDTISADVTDRQQLAGVFKELDQKGVPLRGIIHAAGVNWMRKIRSLDREALLEALKVKVSASFQLHELTGGMDLDFFIMFSSVSALWGSVDLAHYTASNHFLDALSYHRRRQTGKHALTIDWGPWSEVGMSAQEKEVVLLSKLGFRLMPSDRALAGMENLLAADTAQSLVTDIDWTRFKYFIDFSVSPSFFNRVRPRLSAADDGDWPGSNDTDSLKSQPPQEVRSYLLSLVRQQLAAVMLLDPAEELDLNQRLNFMGMDSLMAITFTIRLENVLGVILSKMLVYDYPTTQAVVDHLYQVVRGEISQESSDESPAITNRISGGKSLLVP